MDNDFAGCRAIIVTVCLIALVVPVGLFMGYVSPNQWKRIREKMLAVHRDGWHTAMVSCPLRLQQV